MSKKPRVEDSTPRAIPKQVVPKRQLSKWEKERKRRRILGIVVALVIVAVVGLISYGYYDIHYKPWHQPIVKVNGQVYDMRYFVKMLRLYGAGQNSYQDMQLAYYIADVIRDNELVRQEAEDFDIAITDDEIEEELRSEAGYDPENETLDEFNQRVEEVLKDRGLSLADFKQLAIEPVLLQNKLLEAMGDEKFPVDKLYGHVQVHAILLGTEEEAEEARGKWDGDFNQIIKDYSPTRYYPQGGYWLVMVTSNDGEGEEGKLYIKAILLATKEKAEEVATELDGDNFAKLAEAYSLDSSAADGGDMGWLSLDEIESKFGDLDTIQALALNLNTFSAPITENYPKDSVEWLPQGIESSAFEDYAFNEGNLGSGVSSPIQDTAYYTQGGYWLVMVLEKQGEGEEEELHLQGILMDSEKMANEVKAKIEGDGDFAALAAEYSLHSSSKSSGGDMGWIGVDDVESRFGEETLNLGEGDVSEPIFEDISKQSGYWLIQVLDKQNRTLIEDHRDTFISQAFNDWLDGERNSEENEIVNYLDGEEGYEKIVWALAQIG